MPSFSSLLKSILVPTLVLGVAAQAAAQVAFRYTKMAFSYIRNAEVPAVIYDVRLEGGTLIIEFTEPAQACCPESKARVEIQAADLDLNAIQMKRYWDIGPDEPQAMRLSCRDDRTCVTRDRGGSSAAVEFLCVTDDCRNLRDALGAAVARRAPPQTRAAPPGRAASPETVIDGSKIPSRIDFPGKGAKPKPPPPAAATTPADKTAVDRAPVPVRESLSGLFQTSNAASVAPLPPATPGALSELFSIDSPQPKTPARERSDLEAIGARVFDALREQPTAPDKSLVRRWLDEKMQDISRAFTVRLVTGRSFEELPLTFQRDYGVWEAGLNRVARPFSLKAGFELVDRFGALFDLW